MGWQTGQGMGRRRTQVCGGEDGDAAGRRGRAVLTGRGRSSGSASPSAVAWLAASPRYAWRSSRLMKFAARYARALSMAGLRRGYAGVRVPVLARELVQIAAGHVLARWQLAVLAGRGDLAREEVGPVPAGDVVGLDAQPGGLDDQLAVRGGQEVCAITRLSRGVGVRHRGGVAGKPARVGQALAGCSGTGSTRGLPVMSTRESSGESDPSLWSSARQRAERRQTCVAVRAEAAAGQLDGRRNRRPAGAGVSCALRVLARPKRCLGSGAAGPPRLAPMTVTSKKSGF